MKTFQRFLDSLPPRFSDLEQLPQNFLTAWQWFDQQEKKLPHGYEDASAAVKAIIISMALAALNGKKVRFSDFKQWRWNKDINDKFYQMKNNLNANREKGLIASTSAWLIVSQNMLTIAENLMHYMAKEDEVGTQYSYKQYEDNLAAIKIKKNYPLYYGYRAIGAFTKRIPKKSILYYARPQSTPPESEFCARSRMKRSAPLLFRRTTISRESRGLFSGCAKAMVSLCQTDNLLFQPL